jgi:tetratricopeptide (TPR) repeat protein
MQMKTLSRITLTLIGAAGLCGCDETPARRPQAGSGSQREVAPVQPGPQQPTRLAPPPAIAPSVAKAVPVPQPPAPPAQDRGAETLRQARRLLAQGEPEEALVKARRAVKLSPSSFLAWNTLGRAELENDHGKEAQQAFGRALELKSDSSYAHNNLGLAYLYEENWEQALAELEKATALTPVKPYMWNNLGIALEHLDRLDEARRAYEKGAEDGSESARASLVRLAGVRSIKTARLEPAASPAAEVPDDSNVPGVDKVEKVDGDHE